MRITHDLLINSAKDFTARTIKADRSITAAYLTGSLLTDDPLLGGTTDIDLVFIHDRTPPLAREIQRFTDEITLDLYHHDHSFYDQPRLLRLDPILGPAINATRVILHDTQHWFEYTQAIITAQFDRPDHHAGRVHKLFSDARSDWWLLENKEFPSPKDLLIYLNSVERSTNALASISGLPLTERRFILSLAERCQAVNSPQIALAFSTLLGFSAFDFSRLEEWISHWENAFTAADNPPVVPPDVHPFRKLYYLNAMKACLEEGQLESCLWILLSTWTELAASLSNRFSAVKEYPVFMEALGFDKHTFHDKISLLDQYLDTIEEQINIWSQETGASVA
jgi:hypothetical protein